MENFADGVVRLIGGPGNSRIVLIVGLALAFLAALPDLVPTLLSLLGLLPIKESALGSIRNSIETTRGWSPRTRGVMALAGLATVLLGGMAFFTSRPQALADERVILQDTTLKINVMVNDSGADRSRLKLARADEASENGGAVACSESGLCTYTPPPGFNGDDRFTYDISDENNARTTGMVLVHVREKSPEAIAAASQSAAEAAAQAAGARITPSSQETATTAPEAAPTATEAKTAATAVAEASAAAESPAATAAATPTPTPTLAPEPTFTPTPTGAPASPTFTPTGTPTLTEAPLTLTDTATPTPAPQPGDPVLAISGLVYLRPGPGKLYGKPLMVLEPDAVLPLLGSSPDGFWWQVACPAGVASPGGCWVTATTDYAAAANAAGLPVVPPPPTPTPSG